MPFDKLGVTSLMARSSTRLMVLIFTALVNCISVQTPSNQLIYDSSNRNEKHEYVVLNNGPVYINQYHFHKSD